jgi:hypothetical protein
MRITEASLRKIVREMLKEAFAGASNAKNNIDPDVAAAGNLQARVRQAQAQAARADNAAIFANRLANRLGNSVGTPTPAAPQPAPQTPPAAPPAAARQPRGNPTVTEVQKLIGERPDGFWGQQTQAKFINFVQSKIDEGITLLSVDRGRQISANELSNWKDIASQIGHVGNIFVEKKFEPNINGLFEFLTFLNNTTAPMTNPLAAPPARPITIED